MARYRLGQGAPSGEEITSKYGDKLLTKPSRSSQRQFRAKINKLLGELKTAPQEMVIGKLNPVIRGWANYHRHKVSKRVFCTMDHWLWERLWRWCRRRHPKKNGHWIADRYFVREGTRGWIFQASQRVVKGKIVQRPRLDDRPYPTLLFMADTKIQRHRKIKQDANPYDPEWEMYFEERITRKLKQYLRGKPRTLWGLQEGICPECKQRLDLKRSWEIHHVVYRCHGGPDTCSGIGRLSKAQQKVQVCKGGWSGRGNGHENESLPGPRRVWLGRK